MRKWILLAVFTVFLLSFITNHLAAQCIQTFPYKEDFEGSDGNWVAGGDNSDWAWGTPKKQVINKAASGLKCWITGGLTGSTYSSNAKAYLQSPCFNLSSLVHPYFSCKIFWETEKRYDGATLQYSINGGVSWQTLGTYADGVNCPNDHWFNTAAINTIGGTGWSGNVQSANGGGSGKWVSSKHDLQNLVGKINVMFRFLFGAGSILNDFDGFAVDDIYIGETPANVAIIQYNCAKNKAVDFSANDAICPSVYLWDFGDPTTGTANSSTDQNPQHQFSQNGLFTVTLTITNPSAPTVSTNITLQITDANIQVIKSISCHGDSTGILSATVNGIPDTYTYLWNGQSTWNTPTISKLPANTYQVDIKGLTTCVYTTPFILTEPKPVQHSNLKSTQPICLTKGEISFTATGGNSPYRYAWIPNASTTDFATGLRAGTYAIKIQDANGCKDSFSVVLQQQPSPLSVSLGADTLICPGEPLVLSVASQPFIQWQDGTRSTDFNVVKSGKYSVLIKDNNGCEARDTINVTVKCDEVYFPSAFSPNFDGKNDAFGPAPIGALAALNNYELNIYSRTGQLVFSSHNPYERWYGYANGLRNAGSYVWLATYSIANKKRVQKTGVLTLFW